MLQEGTKFTEEKQLPAALQLLVALGTPKSPRCLGRPGLLWQESSLSRLASLEPFYKPALIAATGALSTGFGSWELQE